MPTNDLNIKRTKLLSLSINGLKVQKLVIFAHKIEEYSHYSPMSVESLWRVEEHYILWSPPLVAWGQQSQHSTFITIVIFSKLNRNLTMVIINEIRTFVYLVFYKKSSTICIHLLLYFRRVEDDTKTTSYIFLNLCMYVKIEALGKTCLHLSS